MPDQERAQARRARLRKAAERLYGDSRLRDELTDEEAQQLLSWAYHRLEEAVDRTQEMPEEEAISMVEGQSDDVESVVRRVNAIMAEFSKAAEGESTISPKHFVQALRQVEERREQAAVVLAPEALVEGLEDVDRETLFQRLMNRITAGDETE